MPLTIVNGPFIQPGESLSDAVDLRAGEIVRITMPGAWDGANLTFQLSSDGILFNDVVDKMGEPVQIAVVPGSCVLSSGGEWTRAFAFVKVRSGTADHPIPQRELREFAFAIETPEPVR